MYHKTVKHLLSLFSSLEASLKFHPPKSTVFMQGNVITDKVFLKIQSEKKKKDMLKEKVVESDEELVC